MPTLYKGQTTYSLEELRTMLKASNRERAAEIPAILKSKQEEKYV